MVETILVNEGQLLMTRWFLVGKNEDLALARKKFEQADIDESDVDSKGQGAYFLGASYEKLARWAGDIERPRDAQIALIRAGIEANKAGRARYPFDSTIGLNALYRSLEMVTERSALAPYVDEWVDYMKSQSEESQMIAAPYLADALFQQGRDVEGLAWIERYAKHAERADVSPDDEPRVSSLRCRDISPLLNQGIAQYARRDPANFEKLGNRVCKGEFADRLMGRSPASANQKP
ncbi:hypothetical protein [Variovorax sp. E3]|uniref:hypothetical protein n=1 Tax=Variovorax sp. E3 TaxID=1914993 RepID=UPI0018DEB8AF|nr:hypothetical protein [Variovorax sp. E3]